MRIFLLLTFLTCLSFRHYPVESYPEFPADAKMKGLSFVAPPKSFPANPMPEIRNLGADWIAVIPFAYTRDGEPMVHYNSHWQWWGERPEGVRRSIEMAKASGLKVMLKPQVYVPGNWPGGIDFETETAWESWEQGYKDYILPFVKIANELEVELFCLGTEFKISEQKRPGFWKDLIREVRAQYCGELTYAANWDNYEQVPFWAELDYIGIDAYFPLSDENTPGVARLVKAWQPIRKKIRNFSGKTKKPVIFTEYGYLSVDACASKTWELEKRVNKLPVNEKAQANAIAAVFETFWSEKYWAGGFLWKWFPNMQGHEGYIERDYTPQGKLGEKTLKEWFSPVVENRK